MRRSLFAFVASVVVTACGGATKYTIDDSVLAQVSLDDKKAMLAAQQERTVAKEELLKATVDAAQADRERDIAQNEHQAAKLALDSAGLAKKGSDASGDVNRKAAGERDLRVATLGAQAAAAKLDWARRKSAYLNAIRRAAEEHVAAADAQYELEKAKLAAAKGIKPSEDFKVSNFETASQEHAKSWSEAKSDAEKRKPEVEDFEKKYNEKNQEWLTAKDAQASR